MDEPPMPFPVTSLAYGPQDHAVEILAFTMQGIFRAPSPYMTNTNALVFALDVRSRRGTEDGDTSVMKLRM